MWILPSGGHLSWLFIGLLCQVSLGLKPTITPSTGQIVKNEGDPLEITCTSPGKIYFFYPVTVVSTINTSDPEINEQKGVINSYEFKRPHTVFGDTGWYGCADHDVNVTRSDYFNPDISWIYVYVRSNNNYFVRTEYFAGVNAISGDWPVFPCRPTSPDLRVQLIRVDSEDELIEKASFDPRIGFTLPNVTVHDSGYYKCVITVDDEEHNSDYHLQVYLRKNISEPKIIEDNLRHVTRGQTLHVNCTIEMISDSLYEFNWTTPQRDSRITTKLHSEPTGPNTVRVTYELIITNVMEEDEGDYECTMGTQFGTKRVKKRITIHDPRIKYINLTTQDATNIYERHYGDKVQWVVYVDSYPQADLRWLNPNGDQILAEWLPDTAKHAISKTDYKTILRINSLDLTDMGNYSLQADIGDRFEFVNFTLDVLVKPSLMMENTEAYFAPNQRTELMCHVVAYPTPNVTWSFRKCPNYPSLVNSTVVQLPDSSETVKLTSVTSTMRMTIELSGLLNCSACNDLGCEYVIQNLLVSDVRDGFGIIVSQDKVAEGDDIDIICGASVYNYTSELVWHDGNYTILQETERLIIFRDKTPFTYRSILRIKNAQKNDSQIYTCAGRNTHGISQDTDYNLIVRDPIPPYFTETNMNETETIVDVNNDGHKTFTLKCFSIGLPKPNITWYKNNVQIKQNEQYFFEHNNQELHIKYLLERDTGKYMCRSESRLGKVETYQQITMKGKGLPIVIIVLITVLVLLVIILLIYFTLKVRREKIMRKELIQAGLMHFEEGALECLNPDLTVDDQAELLPYDKKWEFPRERLKLGKQLGSGAFGVVMKAEAQGICEEETVTTVAVKMVRRTTDPTYVRALASELKIMVHLGKHLNVVNLLGACTKNISKRELLVIVEYCRFGNLHNYLLRHRGDFINQIDSITGKFDPTIGSDILTRTVSVGSNNRIKYAALSFSRSLSVNSATDSVHYSPGTATDSQGVSMLPDGCVLSNNSSQPGWRSNYRGDYKDQNLKPICTQDLLSWAFQVARGMEYLSQRRVLHGDLAARNILLAEDNVVKICDFGLAKTMYKDDNYRKKGSGPLPIKWMAIESIRDRVFSTQSDIWSFGIVLWEFFTLAETPYPGQEAEKQYQKLIEGYRLEQPEYATKDVYDIMLQCWKAKPTLRPSFTELVDNIGDLLEESVRVHYVSLNAPYIDMNTMILESGKNDYLTMMSAPDHTALSSPTHEYVNSPIQENPSDSAYLCMSPSSHREESGIFSPRPHPESSHFEFPSPTSDSEDAVELSPMLKKMDEDPYLKPINVQERRAEFARQRKAMKDQSPTDRVADRDSGYCNTPRNLHLIDLNGVIREDEKDDHKARKEFSSINVPSIVSTTDNYVNMPQQKSDLKKDLPDGFSNPSYIMMSK